MIHFLTRKIKVTPLAIINHFTTKEVLYLCSHEKSEMTWYDYFNDLSNLNYIVRLFILLYLVITCSALNHKTIYSRNLS